MTSTASGARPAVAPARRTGTGASQPPVRASWLPDLMGTLGAGTLLVVLALWVGHRGLQDLFTPATTATSVGRLTGLVAADLLLIQVFLMARVPWIEQSWGQDRLARWHRLVGFTSFNLMVAHIGLITLGYAITARESVFREAWDLVVDYPGMLLAAGGTVALCAVVASSIRAARRRLRYESWHLLHLYAYLGVGLALPHELWTGSDFLGSTVSTWYWWGAYAVAAGSVLVFRLGVPLARNLRHRVRVQAVVPETPGVVSVWLTGHRLDRLPVRSGQFFQWRFLTGPGWSRAHPYSLSAAPQPNLLRITVKQLGDGSALVERLRPGTRVLIEGPYGTLTGSARQRTRVTMIASGIGITPLRALLESLPYPPGGATLIYRARTGADFAFEAELRQLAGYRGIRLHFLPGRRAGPGRWAPAGQGADDKLLRRLVPDLVRNDVFVCGPDEWTAAVVRAAHRAGVPDAQLHLEQFTW